MIVDPKEDVVLECHLLEEVVLQCELSRSNGKVGCDSLVLQSQCLLLPIRNLPSGLASLHWRGVWVSF